LVGRPTITKEYVHSSAKYYETDEQGVYPVTNYVELGDIDLTDYSGKSDPLIPGMV
jgi:hypothetical protein